MKSLALADHSDATVQHWFYESLYSFQCSRVLLILPVSGSCNVSDTWVPSTFPFFLMPHFGRSFVCIL